MYRDPMLQCPQCGVQLVALDSSREKWRCKQCVGVLVGALQIDVELGHAGRHGIFTSKRRGPSQLPCPLCRQPMDRVQFIGIEIDRCVADGIAWFDPGELGRATQTVTSAADAAAAAFLAGLVR